jgi:predicted DCC family thiol-disulfide oxidoreductase YuxK
LEPTHPLNVAIVRVLVFADCLYQLDWEQTLWFSRLPRQLLFPPNSLAPIVKYLPISPELATVAALVFGVGCVLGLIGLCTRWATLVVLLSGLYVLLVPQLWGKVDTNNHVLWFVAVLLFSPCSDALSVDVIRRAWSHNNGDTLMSQRPSAEYALPLRIMWLLLGIIYLFPGLWKFRSAGFDWGTREIFNILYQKWFEIGWWTPIVRIDNWPTLLMLVAYGTIAWESSFIVLILFSRTRALAAAAGTLFHLSAALFLRIFLFDINLMYVSFFDVAGLCRRLGAKLFPTTVHVVYEDRCWCCRASVGTMHLLDVFGRLHFIASTDLAALAQIGVDGMDASKHLQTRIGNQVSSGLSAYQAVARRLPLTWVLLPFSRVRPLVASAEALYGRIVAPKHNLSHVAASAPRHGARSLRPVAIVGAILIVGNSIAGWRGITSWPFTVYPTFACCVPTTANVIVMDFIGADGRPLGEIKAGQIDPALPVGSERLSALVTKVLALDDPARQQDALRALVDVERQSSPRNAPATEATEVRIYRQEYDVNPDRSRDPPIRQEFILSLPLSKASRGTPRAAVRQRAQPSLNRPCTAPQGRAAYIPGSGRSV